MSRPQPTPLDASPWALSRNDYQFRWRSFLPSDRDVVPDVVSRLLQIARSAGFSGNCGTDLEIAIKEALANAIKHGNSYSKTKRVYVRCYAAPRKGFLVLVRDEGSGFDPNAVPDPRGEDRLTLPYGRGLFLMGELMDFIEYRKNGCDAVLFKSYQPDG
jgi:serine/threonine-protein kinase RsbW